MVVLLAGGYLLYRSLANVGSSIASPFTTAAAWGSGVVATAGTELGNLASIPSNLYNTLGSIGTNLYNTATGTGADLSSLAGLSSVDPLADLETDPFFYDVPDVSMTVPASWYQTTPDMSLSNPDLGDSNGDGSLPADPGTMGMDYGDN
jgi:hypothetical protein